MYKRICVILSGSEGTAPLLFRARRITLLVADEPMEGQDNFFESPWLWHLEISIAGLLERLGLNSLRKSFRDPKHKGAK
jgi:hypothetical protein